MEFIENIKEAVKIVQQIDNIELYRKLLDLQAEALDLSEQLRNKDKKIKELEQALEFQGKLILKDSAYYLTDDGNNIIDGPFCTKCFDVDHIKCRIVINQFLSQTVHCLKCNKSFPSSYAFNYLNFKNK